MPLCRTLPPDKIIGFAETLLEVINMGLTLSENERILGTIFQLVVGPELIFWAKISGHERLEYENLA